MRRFYTWALLGALVFSVTPRRGFAPAKLTLKIKTDAGDTVSALIDDDSFSRRSDYPNDGATHWIEWRDVPAGPHTIHVFAYDHGTVVAHVTQSVELLSPQ